ncbi:membrane protein insertase YidC [Kaistia algarum]|uniref:membrane protein insertase YidC n=1 Tax=Kaistia algarum TaxID=2083279 RepID=UPI000CE811FC|nr:membrane protein insertase YidC [Kaistia algarum]MCX5516613.1 membrane protein insertase YidC [Kaistia algarum]PPE77745.1 membrane protein insertase YidC [Kaistia algarum]
MTDNRNLILAVVLSIAVVFGWQYFIAGPQMAKNKPATTAVTQSATPGATTAAGAPAAAGTTAGSAPAAPADGTLMTREAAIASTPRVAIETRSVSGSINLKGGRLDDLRLNDYRVTVDPSSPTIILLSPASAADGYFAELGWVPPADGTKVPGADTLWTASADAKLTSTTPVVLTWDNGAGLTFKRTISVDPSYMFTSRDEVLNATGKTVELAPYGRVTRLGEPVVGGYYILHEGLIGWMGDQHLQEVTYKKLRGEPPQNFTGVKGGWLGITDKYWATAVIPRGEGAVDVQFKHVDGAVPLYQSDFKGQPLTIAAGATGAVENLIFAGAKQVSILDGYRDNLKIDRFDLLIDWGWFWFFTKPLFYLMDYFYKFFGNFGIAILLVTVIVKAVFFPLANKSYKSMSAMKKVQPEMAALRERFADDKVKQQQELMALYKREKINPLAGCWPVAIQIPVFFSLYKVIFITIEMRHAPFFGWIHDLSAPDPTNLFTLFGLIPWSPPHLLMIGIWPLIMGVTMWVQMRLNPAPADPAQQVIFNWMPVIFTFMLGSFPAGLVIYWSWNNTLSVTQQYVIMRRQGVDVNLIGNILSSFKKKPKDGEPAPAAKLPAAANANPKPSAKPPTKPGTKSTPPKAKS